MNPPLPLDATGAFLQTPHYLLRPIALEEKPCYQRLAQAETPDFLKNTGVSAALAWEELCSPEHLTCSILRRDTQSFCGFCQLQWIHSSTPELGIDLLPACQNQGIATEVLPAFLAWAKKLLPVDYFYSKIRKNNHLSQRLAEKIGGVPMGEKSLLPAHFPKEMAALAEKEFPQLFYLEYRFYINEK